MRDWIGQRLAVPAANAARCFQIGHRGGVRGQLTFHGATQLAGFLAVGGAGNWALFLLLFVLCMPRGLPGKTI